MFRIEYVLPRCPDKPKLWRWSVKVPSGLYELLSTDDDGRGLFIRRLPGSPAECPAHLIRLLSGDEFHVPDNLANDQSIKLLEAALNKLGWDGDFIVLIHSSRTQTQESA